MSQSTALNLAAVTVLLLYINSSLALLMPVSDCDKFEKEAQSLKRSNSLLLEQLDQCRSASGDNVHLGDLTKKLQPRYKDCTDVQELSPGAPSGVYTVYTGVMQVATRVYCDLNTQNCDSSPQQGGWTTLLRRYDGSVRFNLGWSEMKSQIGELTGEHWIGLDSIHRITSQGEYELLVELEGHTESVFALYDRFWIEGDQNMYKLHVSGYNNRSTIGDSLMWYHNGQTFSTQDADHDTWSSNCAARYEGAWWYISCYSSNLLGTYRYTTENRGVVTSYANSMIWKNLKGPATNGYYYALKAASMKVRRIVV